jgi:GTP-binding protein
MKDLLRRSQYLLSETVPGALRPSISEVAFVGRSNVGKSSLLNALCDHKGLADVSKMPGRTRMINVYAAAHLRWLIDLPGYGFALGSDELRKTWAAMIEQYLTSRKTLRAVLVLFDSKIGPQPMDHEMREWLIHHQLPYILVGNKIDQVPSSKLTAQQTQIAKAFHVAPGEIRWVSATHGAGLKALRKVVVELLERDQYSPQNALLST